MVTTFPPTGTVPANDTVPPTDAGGHELGNCSLGAGCLRDRGGRPEDEGDLALRGLPKALGRPGGLPAANFLEALRQLAADGNRALRQRTGKACERGG